MSSYEALPGYFCKKCTSPSPFHRHSYYWPSPIFSKENPPVKILVAKCKNCNGTITLYPSVAVNTRKVSIKDKLQLTHEYITTEGLSYQKLADNYNISKSYAYKIVQEFKEFDYSSLIEKTQELAPDYDILSGISSVEPNKPYILPSTPRKLLNALQSIQIINKALPIFMRHNSNSYINDNIMLQILINSLHVCFPIKQ